MLHVKQIKTTNSAVTRAHAEYDNTLLGRSDLEKVLKSVAEKRIVENKIIGASEVNKLILKYPVLISNEKRYDNIYNNVEIEDANSEAKM